MSRSKTERPGRGESVIDFPDHYTVVDIETTGLSPLYCEIIEIAAIKYSGTEKTAEFSTLVKPVYPIDDFIASYTNITNEMVKDAPDISDAILKFHDFLGDDLIVGYNVSFDVNFLYDNLLRCSGLILSNPWLNIQRIGRKLLPKLDSYSQTSVATYYNLSIEGAHRAAKDCELTHALYEQFKKEILASGETFDDFKDRYNRRNKHKSERIEVSSNITEFDTEHPLYGKTCVFTGKLERMPRKEAAQLVIDHGGYFEDNVTKRTNCLIIGDLDYSKSMIKGGKSNKQKKAEKLILEGQELNIFSEETFYDMVFDEENR